MRPTVALPLAAVRPEAVVEVMMLTRSTESKDVLVLAPTKLIPKGSSLQTVRVRPAVASAGSGLTVTVSVKSLPWQPLKNGVTVKVSV